MIEKTYRKRYKMRLVGKDLAGVEVTIPKLVIEREALKCNLTVEQFVKQFCVIAHFDGVEGVLYTFELRK